MRLTSLALTLALVAVVGTAANADTMGTPKPSPSAMHSSMMKSNHMMKSTKMKATPKPSAMPKASTHP